MLNDIAKYNNFFEYCVSNDFKKSEFNVNETKVTVLDAGIIEFRPKGGTDNNVLISCGIHGDETIPIEFCNQMIGNILAGVIKIKSNLQIQYANMQAIIFKKRYIENNLNRLFSNQIQFNSIEQERAKQLMRLAKKFKQENPKANNIHFDLHSSIRKSKYDNFAIYPSNQLINSNQITQCLKRSNIQAVILSNTKSKTYSNFTKNINYNSLTLEIGHVGQENIDVKLFKHAISNLLQKKPNISENKLKNFKVTREIFKKENKIQFNFDDETENFTEFQRGSLIGYNNSQEIITEHEKELILFPNQNVNKGERALLLITPI